MTVIFNALTLITAAAFGYVVGDRGADMPDLAGLALIAVICQMLRFSRQRHRRKSGID